MDHSGGWSRQGAAHDSWPSFATDLINGGANWPDEASVVDGNLVTSRKPDDIPAFNHAMIRLFQRIAGAQRRAA